MKGIIFYTDCRIEDPIKSLVRSYLTIPNLPIVSCSLKPIDFGENIVLENEERSYVTMVKQIIAALEASKSKYVFFCEHDVLYSPSHFDFTPPKDDVFYYNTNVWRWLLGNEKAIRYELMIPLSVMCCNREFALDHYNLRLKTIKEKGFDKIEGNEPYWARKMGYEPGTKGRRKGGITDDVFDTWSSDYPNIDIRHGKTFSSAKCTQDSFRRQPKNWTEIPIGDIEGWGKELLLNLLK